MTQSLATIEAPQEGLAARLQREARERKRRFFGPLAKKPTTPIVIAPTEAAAPSPLPYGDPVPVITKAIAAVDSFNFHSHCPSLQLIFRVVANDYGVTPIEILSSRRDASIVRPRQVAMYLAKILTTRSLPEIGRRMGGRDHTTVLHGVRKVEDLVATDAKLGARVATITETIRGHHAGSHGAAPILIE